GLIGALSTYARVNDFGFIESPYRKVIDGKVTNDIVWLTADEEEDYVVAQANEPLDDQMRFRNDRVLVRRSPQAATLENLRAQLERESYFAATTDISAVPPAEVQLVDEERHLVGRPLGERVAQVGVAEVVGERLEPVAGGVGHRAPIVPRAPGAAAVWAPWTSPSPAATGRSPAASSACWPATATAPGPSSATRTTSPTSRRPGPSPWCSTSRPSRVPGRWP